MKNNWAGVVVLAVLTGCGGDDDGGSGAGGMGGGAGGMGAGASGMSAGASGMGGSSGMGGAGAPSGMRGHVVAPWDQFCVLTFTDDFDVIDSFGDRELSIRAGDRYLQGEGFFGSEAILYLAPAGPVEFEIDADDPSAPPYTSSCDGIDTDVFVAAIVDTTVFSDQALTMPLCTIAAGARAPGGLAYGLASDLFAQPSVYEVTFNALAEHCGGVSTGFIAGIDVTVGSATYTDLGLAKVLGPAAP